MSHFILFYYKLNWYFTQDSPTVEFFLTAVHVLHKLQYSSNKKKVSIDRIIGFICSFFYALFIIWSGLPYRWRAFHCCLHPNNPSCATTFFFIIITVNLRFFFKWITQPGNQTMKVNKNIYWFNFIKSCHYTLNLLTR